MYKYNSIFFCTADPTKNAGEIKKYFIENAEYFSVFHFYLGYMSGIGYFEKFHKGLLVQKKTFNVYKGKNVYIKNSLHYIFYFIILLFYVKRNSFVIINSPVFCIGNSILSAIKSLKFVFWIGDYYPQKNFPMNIYHKVVDFYNNSLKYVLYLSPPLEKIYLKKVENKDGKIRKTVQLGIKQYQKRRAIFPKNKKVKIGFIGIIREQQGLELVFSLMQKNKKIYLEVVGDGYKLGYYKDLAKKLKIFNRVVFHGRVNDVSEIFYKWDIGIALYEQKSNNLSIYCEPTKIKHYLSFGLPVITTKTTYFHKEINEKNAGIVIDENTEDLSKAIYEILDNYPKFVMGVNKLLKKYEYKSWYDRKLEFMQVKNSGL